MKNLLVITALLVPSLALATQFGGDATAKNHNKVNNANVNGNFNKNNNDNTNKARSASKSRSSSSSGASSRANNRQSLEITHEAQDRDPVNTAYAPTVVTGPVSCAHGLSGGVQAPNFGISLGGSTEDPRCEARLDARELSNMGFQHVAVMRLCQVPEIAKAFRDAGDHRCPVTEAEVETVDQDSP